VVELQETDTMRGYVLECEDMCFASTGVEAGSRSSSTDYYTFTGKQLISSMAYGAPPPSRAGCCNPFADCEPTCDLTYMCSEMEDSAYDASTDRGPTGSGSTGSAPYSTAPASMPAYIARPGGPGSKADNGNGGTVISDRERNNNIRRYQNAAEFSDYTTRCGCVTDCGSCLLKDCECVCSALGGNKTSHDIFACLFPEFGDDLEGLEE
jgi:hypothetical protein